MIFKNLSHRADCIQNLIDSEEENEMLSKFKMLLELLLLLICLYFIRDYLQTLQLEKKLGPIPIVSRIPVIGISWKLLSFQPENLHLKFREFTERYGKTFAGRVFGFTMVVTSDERLIEQLISSPRHTRKLRLYGLLSTWLGSGLLLSHGAHWQKMRKIITPTFHFKILERFVKVFDKQSKILVEKLGKFSDGKTVCNIFPYMGHATLDIIAETAMGVKVNAQDNEESNFVQAVNNVTEIIATRFMRPHLAFPIIFQYFTPNLYAKLKSGMAVMHEFTEAIIRERRMTLQNKMESIKNEEEIGRKSHSPFLDVLLRATIDDGKPLTDKQIRDEVNTFMFEGHDTTSSATSFCLYLLSRNPWSQQKLFDEIHTHFGNDVNRPIKYHDFNELNYLTCVVKESLRLYPPIPSIGRWLEDELKMDDITLSAGTNITLLLWELLRNPEFFPEPEIFRPERHIENSPNAFVYMPFSAGLRNCIGQRFAMLEMKTIIVNVIRSYELFEAGEDVHPSIKIVLKSSTGVNFGIRQRPYMKD